jgi:aerobic-type carbon monoxide dehydrogenase small subunit (CoxS/CutS family)
MIMAASDLLRENPHPSDEEIREGLEGQPVPVYRL